MNPRRSHRLKVQSLDAVGLSLYRSTSCGAPELAERETVEKLLKEAAVAEGTNFALTFLMSEWERVIDAWQLEAWDDYRDVRRIGRYRRLSEAQREALWPVLRAGQGRTSGSRVDNLGGNVRAADRGTRC